MTAGKRSGRILIVDDEEIYCSQLSVLLEGAGHKVRTARTGREALALGRRFHPGLLLVDWALGGGWNGIEVGRALMRELPSLKIVPITGHAAGDVERAADVQVASILEKPFGIEEVLAAVRDALARGATGDAAGT